MSKYTKEQKIEYFKNIREQWKKAKKLSEKEGKEIEAIQKNYGLRISATSYMVVKLQLEKLKLKGVPYIDTKTYNGWIENGFKVKKGEKAKIDGITWIDTSEEDEEATVFPKVYKLFHTSQVEKIK